MHKKNNNFYHVLLIILFALPGQIWGAETLKIHLMEKGSGDVIEQATVVVVASEEYETSDENGWLELQDVTFPLDLKILASGYLTQLHSIEMPQKEIAIYIEPQVIEGAGLEVVEKRIVETTSKIVLQSQELRNSAGSRGDPVQVLTSIPGIVNQGPVFYVRGSGADESDVWVNRIPVSYIIHWADISGGLSTLNPDLLSDFNAFLGGFPVEYPDALGGMLDAKLRAPKKDRLHQNYRVGLNESAFLLEGPVGEKNGKNSFFLTGRRSYLDVIFTPERINQLSGADDTNQKTQIIKVPQYYDMQASFRHELTRGNLDIHYLAAGDALGINIRAEEDKNTDPDLFGELSRSIDYKVLGVNWQQLWKTHWSSVTTLSFTNEIEKTSAGQDEAGSPFFIDVNLNELNFQPEIRYSTKDYQWVFGGAFRYTRIPVDIYVTNADADNEIDSDPFSAKEKFRINTTFKLGNIAPYVKYRRHLTDRLSSGFGLRYTLVQGSYGIEMSDWLPRLSLEYKLTKQTLLTGSWGKYVQKPKESFLLGEFGNPDLSFTKAQHYILGVKHSFNPLWNVLVETYYKPMKDLAFSVADKSPPDNYKNSGEGKAYGVDVLLRREYSARRMGWLAYSYGRSTRTDTLTGKTYDFSGDQRHTFTLLWSHPLFGSWKKWDWGIRIHLRTGTPHTPIIGRQVWCRDTNSLCDDQTIDVRQDENAFWVPINAGKNSARLPMAYKIDMRFERPILFNTWKMSFYVDLQNITAAKNVEGYDYGKFYENTDNPTEITGIPSVLPFIGVEATF